METTVDSRAEEGSTDQRELPAAVLELPYIPDFRLSEIRFWFAPSFAEAKEVYHELIGDAAEHWQSYYTKKGWSFLQKTPPDGEGPFTVAAGQLRLEILDPGRFFAPKPRLRIDDRALPLVSAERRRPLNAWKPNYMRSLNFIKKFDWPHEPNRAVSYAVWEIEECGEVAGSVSWKTARELLKQNNSPELRASLSELFFERPEDFPLGSEVYLNVLGQLGTEGFENLLKLAEHPISRKRKVVAATLGKLQNPAGLGALLVLVEDEDPEVRRQALRALGFLGVRAEDDPEGKISEFRDSEEISHRVWAAHALVNGGNQERRKYLAKLVKEEPRLLADMGDLGDVLAHIGLYEAVPYLIQRLKHEKSEFRVDAVESLEKLTGIELHYQSYDSPEQRRDALKRFQRWWDDFKKKRRERGQEDPSEAHED